MKKMNRRQFLRLMALGMSAAVLENFLSACGQKDVLRTPGNYIKPTWTKVINSSDTPRPVISPTTEAVEKADIPQSQPTKKPSETAIGYPDLVVARHGEPQELVRRAVEALGGMNRIVAKGDDVIIKPNICVAYHTYEYAATTNPWVVAALVQLCLEAGAERVRVMDFPFGGTQEQAYQKSGIQEQVQAAGGEMAFMPGFKYIPVDIPDAMDIKRVEIFDDILNCNVLIDVPIAKHHSLAKLTLGMKNLMGVIKDRSAMHRNLGQRLADLTSLVRPTLTVVDAVRILLDHGPTGGSLVDVKQIDTVIASRDIVAADSYAATLFGKQPGDLDYVRAGAAMGLGVSELGSLRIEEFSVSV